MGKLFNRYKWNIPALRVIGPILGIVVSSGILYNAIFNPNGLGLTTYRIIAGCWAGPILLGELANLLRRLNTGGGGDTTDRIMDIAEKTGAASPEQPALIRIVGGSRKDRGGKTGRYRGPIH